MQCYRNELEQSLLYGDSLSIAAALCDVALATASAGEFDVAYGQLTEAESLYRSVANTPGLERVLRDRGLVALFQGDYPAAVPPLREARRQTAPRNFLISTIFYLGTALCFTGELDEARAYYIEVLRVNEEIDDRFGLSISFLGFAALAHREGDGRRAALLCGAEHSMQSAAGIAFAPPVHALYEREVAQVVALIGQEAFDEAFAAGTELTLDEAIALARQVGTRPDSNLQ